jgi:hypothetical protein
VQNAHFNYLRSCREDFSPTVCGPRTETIRVTGGTASRIHDRSGILSVKNLD